MKSASSEVRALRVVQGTPAGYWDALPLDRFETWVRANIPTGALANLARCMETAHHRAAQKLALLKAADAYLSRTHGPGIDGAMYILQAALRTRSMNHV